MTETLWRQAKIENALGQIDTLWLDKPIKVGDSISLKDSDDPSMLWDVVEVYSHEMPKDQISAYRKARFGSIMG